MEKRVSLIILGLFFVFAFGFAAYAAPNITASLTANPTAFSGKCPAVITFNGHITASTPGRVQYKFIRSDGANAPVQTLNFEKPGTKPVSTTWTLGGAALPTYAGWEAIQVIYPQQVQSNKAEFKIQCQQAQQQRISARLIANPTSFSGKCPAVIKFDGEISVTAPCTVQYKFLRSDGAIDTNMKSLTFEGPGSKPVSTTWTLGGAGLPSYAGWEAIEVVSPLNVKSNKAVFKMQCSGGQDNQGGKKPDLVVEDITLNEACEVVVKVRNIGQGQVPDEVWTVHKPESCAVYLSINGQGWGGGTVWGFDPGKGLQNPGGTATYVSTLKVSGNATVKAEIDHTKQVAESNEANNVKMEKLTCQAGAGTQPGPVSEDCVSFNPATTAVQQIGNDWKIVDGSHWMFSFGTNKAEAGKALAIIKHYRMNESCFVGRPDPSFSYLKVGGAAPAGAFSGEDCIAFNPAAIEVKQLSGDWKIVEGNNWLFSFGSKKVEAVQALAIIKKYGFTQTCFVGRPGPSFKYLRK